MKINFPISQGQPVVTEERREQIRREKTATQFEEIFARHLVKEISKNTFRLDKATGGMGHGSDLYREFITEALAGQLAEQRTLGVADLLMKYWERQDNAVDFLSRAGPDESVDESDDQSDKPSH